MTRARNVADIIKQPFTTTLGTSNYRAGVNAGNSIASGGNFNVCVGDEAGTAINTGDHNTAVGYSAGAAVNTGIQNTLIGALSGDALTDADKNVAIGMGALTTDTEGSQSVAVGHEALANQNFTSAIDCKNTAVGTFAGNDITTGINNTFVGAVCGDALTDADFNVALGAHALTLDTLGSKSAALGYYALGNQNFTSATDSFNVGVGYQAGIGVTTGRANTLIGATAGDSVTSGNDNVIIGYGVDVSSATGNSAIGIGVGFTVAANDFSFGKASNVVTNDFDADAAFSRSSDQRLKTNIAAASLGLDFINDLRPVTYKWKASADLDSNDAQLAHLRVADNDGNIINHMNTDITMHGLIAQEVKTALDTASVSTFKGWHADQYGVQQISREMYVIPLIKAVQELSTALDAALARIATLEG